MLFLNSLEFMGVFLLVFIFTGGFIQFTIAFVTAAVAAYLIRTYVTDKRLPVPARSAILITGCSSGIGEDASLQLSEDGFMVFACVRKQTDADALKAKAVSENQRKLLIPVLLDITNEKQLAQAVNTVKSTLSSTGYSLYGLINNAGVGNNGIMELVSQDTLRQQFELNVFAQVLCTQAFLPLLRSNAVSAPYSRRVIFVSSAVGWLTFPTTGPYSASKHALEAIGDAFRMELKTFGIDVILVEPGSIRTAFRSTAHANADRNFAESRSPFAPSAEIQEAYATLNQKYNASRNKVAGAPVSLVTDALRESLLGSRPMPRILVGKDAAAVPWALMLPDAVIDRVLAPRV